MIDNIINKLLIKCNLGELLEKPTRVMGGLLNRMYKVKTTTGIYAIKFLNPEVMAREDAKENHILAETLSNIAKNNGVKALPAKIINNEILQQIEEHYFLIFDWFEGRAIQDEEITIEKSIKVAKELAKLHKIDFTEFKDKCKAYYDTTEINWDYYIEKIDNKQVKELLLQNINRYKILDKQAIKSLDIISKDMIISHRDLDLPNVLWDKNENPVFIDWESSGLVNPSMEVIDTAWNWSGGQKYFDKEKFRAFINTYKENNGELTNYYEAGKADFKAKFGWLEYNLKRITVLECIDEEEKNLGEKEVIRTIDEINKFDFYSKYMNL